MTIQKQCVGIDVSQNDFVACICTQTSDGSQQFSETVIFPNAKRGYNQLLRWARKQCTPEVEMSFLMEVTGVYYENLAHHLHQLKQKVHVVLPNMSKHYFSSLNIKTKTDAVDARILSRFGVERQHRPWCPPDPKLLKMRNLTRFYVQLRDQKTALMNLCHSKESAHDVQAFIVKSNKTLIKQIERQMDACLEQIEVLKADDPVLNNHMDQLMTISGAGLITVATVVAETLGFEHFKSIKQLNSYAGYDVVQRESGTSIKGKTRISKKGNSYIRAALFFPSINCARFCPEMKSFYARVNANKPSKMIGLVAVQRKLLALMFTLWKTNSPYIEDYQNKVASVKRQEATQDSFIELPSVN